MASTSKRTRSHAARGDGHSVRNEEIDTLSLAARRTARTGDWQTVGRLAREILARDSDSAEGHFLTGQSAKGTGAFERAEKSFRRAMHSGADRYDATVELAELLVRLSRNGEAVTLLRQVTGRLAGSPLYLEMAASAFARMDLHAEALPLYRRACELQPEIERFRTGLAGCCASLGELDEARRIYEALTRLHPDHRRFHYELSRLRTATDDEHVSQMKTVLRAGDLPPEKNIFLYYALGKELEDLERWDEAFGFYEKAGNAVKRVAGYRVEEDLRLVDAVIETCTASWLNDDASSADDADSPQPIFIVGLPRSGTTLLERMIGNHSLVGSVGETFFLQHALFGRRGAAKGGGPGPDDVRRAPANAAGAAARYLEDVRYKLGNEPYFVEKLPENFLYAGFIAKAFPKAGIVHLRRHPLDVCFAMYKQSYFRYAYSLEDVGRFYVAYDRLMSHWRALLGKRLVELHYEDLVTDPEGQIRALLDRLGLPFEEACLYPEENAASSRTASRAQVRERIHSRSIGRWRRFAAQLSGLRHHLAAEGIAVPDGE